MKSGLTAALLTYTPMKSASLPYVLLKSCQVLPLAVATVSMWGWKVTSYCTVRPVQVEKVAVEMAVENASSVPAT